MGASLGELQLPVCNFKVLFSVSNNNYYSFKDESSPNSCTFSHLLWTRSDRLRSIHLGKQNKSWHLAWRIKDFRAVQPFRCLEFNTDDRDRYGARNLCVAETPSCCRVFICLRHGLHAAVSRAAAWWWCIWRTRRQTSWWRWRASGRWPGLGRL